VNVLRCYLGAGLPDGVDKWGVSLKYLMSAVVLLGGVVVAAYTHMQRNVRAFTPSHPHLGPGFSPLNPPNPIVTPLSPPSHLLPSLSLASRC
jgi:hypothetical protein